jgi:hypothetical protein
MGTSDMNTGNINQTHPMSLYPPQGFNLMATLLP